MPDDYVIGMDQLTLCKQSADRVLVFMKPLQVLVECSLETKKTSESGVL